MRDRAIKITASVILILSVIYAVYIMINQQGLVDGLNFGAGAYYYADIPDFERYVNNDVYKSPVSFWLITALFLVWGLFMYKFLLWLDSADSKIDKKEK